MLLLAESQQLELQSESHQLSFVQQGSDWAPDESTALAMKDDQVNDKLLLAASQQFEDQLYSSQPGWPAEATCKTKGLKEESGGDVVPIVPCNSRFASPTIFSDIHRVKESRIPKKTKANTDWATNIWKEWAVFQLEHTGITLKKALFVLMPT